MGSQVDIQVVTNPRAHADFIELPWRVNQGDADWAPPLRMALKKLLDTKKYPFFNHGDAAFFVAYKHGEPVGRIAAIENRLHAKTYDDGVGFFGFFECDDDEQVCRELLSRAATWVKDRGLKRVRGPLNYSVNDENPGVLFEGFNGIPLILMSHNPAYYNRLLLQCGMEKAKDLHAYLVTRQTMASERFMRVMKAVRRRAPALDLREVRLDGKGFREDITTMLRIFNEAWSANWGFLEVTPPEVDAIAEDLKPIVDPAITAIAEIDGQPVGMIVCVPNVNEILHKIPDGKLFPTGWYKLLTGLKKIRGFRTMLMGVVPEYRGRGVDALMIDKVMQSGLEAGYVYCELSWVLEDNEPMTSLADKAGGFLYRKYRIYEADTDALILP
ncbi:MAG: GNAT family N-acetyltransferase [Planctomycetes bacterium]|nr:GNAT family N-acetyltransferase [Planctomycetota bacterium]